MHSLWKELKGEGGGGSFPSDSKEFLQYLELKISDLVHTFGEFLKYCLSKILRRKHSFTAYSILEWMH